jgi:hypothetical protein
VLEQPFHTIIFVCNCKGEGLLNLFQNQRNRRKSKRKRENIGPKHVVAWVLLPGNSSFAR